MTADDRNAGTGSGLYTPRTPDAADAMSTARRTFAPVGAASEAPAQAAPSAQSAPTTGSVPTRTSVRPVSAPQGIPTVPPAAAATQAPASFTPQAAPRTAPAAPAAPAAQPTRPAAPAQAPVAQSTQAPAAPRFGATGAPAAPEAPAAPTAGDSVTGVLGTGTAKLKGLASRAAESFKETDDLSVPASKGGPRRARVLVSRIDPWSALKLGFLMSIAMGIMFVVAVFVIWTVLNEMGTFALVNAWVTDLFTTDQEINIMQFFDQNKVMSAAILLSVVNVVLLTALSTIFAFLYNVVSSVVGGFYVTLTDD